MSLSWPWVHLQEHPKEATILYHLLHAHYFTSRWKFHVHMLPCNISCDSLGGELPSSQKQLQAKRIVWGTDLLVLRRFALHSSCFSKDWDAIAHFPVMMGNQFLSAGTQPSKHSRVVSHCITWEYRPYNDEHWSCGNQSLPWGLKTAETWKESELKENYSR